MSPWLIDIGCHGLERFGANPTDSSVGGYWDCYLVTVILVVWFVYLKHYAVTTKVKAVAAVSGAAAAAAVVAKEMANAKLTVEAEAKTQQSTIKKQKKWQQRQCQKWCGGRQRRMTTP